MTRSRKAHNLAKLVVGDIVQFVGSRERFRIVDIKLNRLGSVDSLFCWNETVGQYRTLYVGRRPKPYKGTKLLPYRVQKVIRAKKGK